MSSQKEQGFSEAVAAQLRILKEDQPDQSMRQVYQFYKRCLSNQGDFRALPLEGIADFLL